jgi:transposase
VQRIRRVHGHMQCAFPGYSVRWNRDINAAINILLNFRYLYKHGELPWEFRRSTDTSSLQRSPAADRKYSRVEGEKGYRRR